MATHGHALQKRFCAVNGPLCTHPSAQKAVAKNKSQISYSESPGGVWFRRHTWSPLRVADLISATWPSPVFLIQCLVAYISLHSPSAGGRVF